MKKWIATYIFFVGFILFSLSGTASYAPEKTDVKKNITSFSKTKLFFFKKGSSHPFSHNADEIGSSFNDLHYAGCSQTLIVLPAEYIQISWFLQATDANDFPTPMVTNGYLLHLFPSHYFW